MDAAKEFAAEELRHDAVQRQAERRLAGAGRADHADDLAAADRQADLVQRRAIGAGIAVADIVEADERRFGPVHPGWAVPILARHCLGLRHQ